VTVDPALVVMIGNELFNAYDAYKAQGLTDDAAKQAAIEAASARYKAGHDAWVASGKK
jgi:hypothetical protein